MIGQRASAVAHLRRHCAPQGLLTTASKAPGGEYAYNTASVPLLAEALKLAVSAWLLERQRRTAPELARTTRSLRGAALFVVPSLIYWLHNNVQARPWHAPVCWAHAALSAEREQRGAGYGASSLISRLHSVQALYNILLPVV